MNFYEEFKSKRFMLIALLVCLAFFIIIIHAFVYLPEANELPAVTEPTNINKPAKKFSNSEEVSENDIAEFEDNVKSQSKKTLNIGIPHANEIKNIKQEDIDFLEDIEGSVKSSNNEINSSSEKTNIIIQKKPDEIAEEFLEKAILQKKDKNYVTALESIVQALKATSNKDIHARCYELAANIYAIEKKYGTALSYAQKAFNLSPSSSREILLARIYYKIGEIDNATKRINNVLQRDFAQDRD